MCTVLAHSFGDWRMVVLCVNIILWVSSGNVNRETQAADKDSKVTLDL